MYPAPVLVTPKVAKCKHFTLKTPKTGSIFLKNPVSTPLGVVANCRSRNLLEFLSQENVVLKIIFLLSERINTRGSCS